MMKMFLKMLPALLIAGLAYGQDAAPVEYETITTIHCDPEAKTSYTETHKKPKKPKKVKKHDATPTANADDSTAVTVNADETADAFIDQSVLGEQKILVVLLDYVDAPCPYSVEEAYLRFIGTETNSLNEVIMAESRGKSWISATVVGPYQTTLHTTNACNIGVIKQAAIDATAAAGINLHAWPRRFYIFPRQPLCHFAGTATLCQSPSDAWINARGGDRFGVINHEYGHNIGLHHSATDANNDGTYADPPDQEYGDQSGVMGYNNFPFLPHNSFSEEWMPATHVKTITGAGTFTLSPYGAPWASETAPEMIRMQRTSNTWYYLSYRTALGWSASLQAGQLDRVYLHWWGGNLWHQCPQWRTYLIHNLGVGQERSVFIPTNITFRVVSVGDNAATIEVKMGGEAPPPPPPPEPVWPSFTGAPTTGTAPLAVTFSNTTRGTALGYHWDFGDGSTSTQPSPIHTYETEGIYTVRLTATDSEGRTPAYNYPDYIKVAAAPPPPPPPPPPTVDNPPTAPRSLSVTRRGKNNRFSWLAASDDKGVASYLVFRGDVQVAETTELTWQTRTGTTTYTYTVKARDTAGQVGPASNSVTVR